MASSFSKSLNKTVEILRFKIKLHIVAAEGYFFLAFFQNPAQLSLGLQAEAAG